MKGLFVLIAAVSISIFSMTAVLPPVAFADTGVSASSSDPNAGIAAEVQSYFSDIPVMVAIAACESGDRQFEADGTPLLGGTGTMVGIFQFDETVHYAKALSLGFDIDTVAGNMGYARYLYGADGTEPWISSFGCWASAATGAGATGSAEISTSTAVLAIATSSTSTASAPVLTLDLSLGEIDPQVFTLQQLLNQDGFILATSGPGSPGNETDKFGALTYAALKGFQCAEGITCSGEEATTGYGFLNAATRAALLAAPAAGGSNASGTVAAATSVSTTTSTDGDPAVIAELQSRIAALVAVVAQLEAEIAARGS